MLSDGLPHLVSSARRFRLYPTGKRFGIAAASKTGLLGAVAHRRFLLGKPASTASDYDAERGSKKFHGVGRSQTGKDVFELSCGTAAISQNGASSTACTKGNGC